MQRRIAIYNYMTIFHSFKSLHEKQTVVSVLYTLYSSNSNSNSNDFIFNIDTNSQNDYEKKTKKGNAGLFVNKL